MPTLQEIITEKLDRLDTVPGALESQTIKEQKKILDLLLKELNDLTTSGGKISLTTENLLKIEEIGNLLQSALFQGDYVKSVSEFANQFDTQGTLNREIFDRSFGNFTDKAIFEQTLQASKVRAIDNLNAEAIAQRFIEPLKQALQNQVVAEAGIAEVAKSMTEFITGTPDGAEGRLLNWVKQTAYDAFAVSDREYSKIIADDLGVDFFKYSGGRIPTSRCFCVKREGHVFHRDEISSWGSQPELWNEKVDGICKTGGMAKGTNEQTIFVYLGGYNCQHSLIPIDEEFVPSADKNRIKDSGLI